MKKQTYIRKIAVIGIITILLSGCDSYLEEKEVPRVTVDFYGTSQGVEAASIAAYAYLRFGVGGEYSNLFTELGTDLITGATGAVLYPTNMYGNSLSPDLANFNAFWENHYKAINTTNLVIGEIPNGNMTEAEKTAAIAEMCFLRAYFYFDLVQQFGKIPLVTQADYNVRTSFKRESVSDIYNFIISDLRFAADNLRESTSAAENNIGKATRYAAAHLLSKVYLTRCSAVTDSRGQKATDPDSALYYAKRVIDSKKYTLVADFADLWNPENQRNSEVVFSVQFTENLVYDGAGNKSHLYWCAMYENIAGLVRDVDNGRPYRFHRATNRTMFELFDRKNDSRFYKSFKWAWYCNRAVEGKLAIGDTALYHSLNPKPDDVTYNYTYMQWNRNDLSKMNDYYPQLIKYIDPNRASVNEQAGSRDWIRMRLGETYLLAAEAAGRKGDFETAAEYINIVRERAAWHDGEAKMPQYWREEGGEYGNTSSTFDEIKVSANDLSTNFVDFILDERGRELLGEYVRWEDLVRCEKLYEYVKTKGYNPEATNIQPYHKLRPIPQKHIDRLQPQGLIEEEQNEGYY
jgi:hypothetical protein